MFSGYKTYITAVVAIVGAVGAWMTGEMALNDMIQIVVTAALGAFIRNGVSTTAAK